MRALAAGAGVVPVTGGLGVLAAVVASVGIGPSSTATRIADRIRPAGSVSVADVDDALACLALVGVVRESPAGCWAPGKVALEELPVPELEEP